jgi:cytochrome c-type biogenesis protein CcmF
MEGPADRLVPLGTVEPEKRFYKKPEQPTTEVSIWSTLGADLYVVLGSYDPATKIAVFQVFLNPLVSWMWIGGLVMAIGTGVCMWPSYAERTQLARESAPAAVRIGS